MKKTFLSIHNLKQNNLNIPQLQIPLHSFTLVQGPSGSGKSSFAIQTLLREGQRRLLQALRIPSTNLPPVHADFPHPLPTTLGIEQDADLRLGDMETLGTYTEIHDQLAHLFVQHGVTHCPQTHIPLPCTAPEEVVSELLEKHTAERMAFLVPLQPCTSQNYPEILSELYRNGFARICIKNKIIPVEEAPPHPPKSWNVVIDRLKVEAHHKDRMYQAILQAYRSIHHRCGIYRYQNKEILWFYQTPYSVAEGRSLSIPSMPIFQFRNSVGACHQCRGKGIIGHKICSACIGTRLGEKSQHILWREMSLSQLLQLPIHQLYSWLLPYQHDLTIKEVMKRLQILIDLQLDYLSLHRSFDSLSTGEKSRLRLFRLLTLSITHALIVLDEPSLGLSQSDLESIIPVILRLAKDNTLIVVDHSPAFKEYADHTLYFGPESGSKGGRLVQPTTFQAPPPFAALTSYSIHKIPLSLIDLEIQSPGLNILKGCSGSGKTRLLNEITTIQDHPYFSSIKIFSGTVFGNTRSCTATICGVWSEIRHLLAQTKESKMNGYSHTYFSFNVEGGRCEACKGMGSTKIHIPPLPPQEEICALCLGNRFNAAILQVTYKGFHAADILNMDIQTAYSIFTHHPKIHSILRTLCQVGLGYLPLGQISSSLSGGERRRLLMAKILASSLSNKNGLENTLLLLDEPSTALHHQDCIYILRMLAELRSKGATIICASNHPLFEERGDRCITLPKFRN